MKQKAFVLQNRGMNRDLSVSKAGESSAYENHNIRILARDHDTLLSVTNERGNKLIPLPLIVGELIGWNVLNEYIILFTHNKSFNDDYIYLIKYNGDGTFQMVGHAADSSISAETRDISTDYLYHGNLGFDVKHPIESVVYYENESVQKIYWVDGKNPLRFMNFVAPKSEQDKWNDTFFDVNRAVDFGVTASISKDNSGNTRANGTVQYILTYYNNHGQESGPVWVSDLVYLAPPEVGGAADGFNNNRITINLSNLDSSYTHFRLYSVVHTALNGESLAYLVYEGTVGSGANAVAIDDGAHLTAVDASRLLFLGSKDVRPGTLTHKDQTLFLGDLQSVGRKGYDDLETAIKTMRNITAPGTGLCNSDVITFSRTSDDSDIEYVAETDAYPYKNQLAHTSSEILSFKGGEKYRFAFVFKTADGVQSDAFWIGDAINTLYPQVSGGKIHRIVATCSVPASVLQAAEAAGFKTVQLMIAEATYADRSVKAQGIVNPTVFNVWNRYKDGLYSASSWLMRPRNSDYACRHFEPIHSSVTRTGEIDCNYWTTDSDPTPYYRLDISQSDPSYIDQFEGSSDYSHLTIVVGLYYRSVGSIDGEPGGYQYQITVVKGRITTGTSDSDLLAHSFVADDLPTTRIGMGYLYGVKEIEGSTYELYVYRTPDLVTSGNHRREAVYASICDHLSEWDIPLHCLPEQTFFGWCDYVHSHKKKTIFFCTQSPNAKYESGDTAISRELAALNSTDHWFPIDAVSTESGWDYTPSYYRKHLMFVDENVVTLNSPELEYEALSFDNADGLKFRVVGVAKITGSYSDYVVEADPGKLPGENLVTDAANTQILSEPLWMEYGLMERLKEEDGETDYTMPADPKDRTSYSYLWGSNTVMYWLHMWNHNGKISGYTDYENNSYSLLRKKVFANTRYAYDTVYVDTPCNYSSLEDLRIFNYTNSQYVRLSVGGKTRHYNAVIQDSLSLPGTHKYPIAYTSGNFSSEADELPWNAYLYSASPILMEYASTPHAVISLGSVQPTSAVKKYTQTILPSVFSADEIEPASGSASETGWIIPWEDNIVSSSASAPDVIYDVNQPSLTVPAGTLGSGDKYVLIGEIYKEFVPGPTDSRYGGTTEAAIKNNRFVVAGPQYEIDSSGSMSLLANQGDTYFQRWDCMKTKPYSTGSVNNVIDVTSVLVETHINLDGRSDLLRGTRYLASVDPEKFNTLNPVYTQQNNFFVSRDLDKDQNLDSYRASITWSLAKTDGSPIDEWAHVTLASTLALDGDKGNCTALRRYNNSLIAFQDRSISEVLFNSRTQLSTTDGVPVEIANTGKVDGKRYLTNKSGCTNKWSIVEGKAGLYFVDNINKNFNALSYSSGGLGVDDISNRLGFSVWFKDRNELDPWQPDKFNNIVSFFDRVNSDVYLVKGSTDDMSCLVFNEKLNAFTSFFDYGFVPMMVNVQDKFVSFTPKNQNAYPSYKNKLWIQNEGLYGNIFGEQKDFSVQYRITPDPFSDKIWSGFDYRADFYHVLNENGETVIPEQYLINGDNYEELTDRYKENETFDSFSIWNEYQTTGEVDMHNDTPKDDPVHKKFRIWRRQIPRALKEGTNKYGLDRIRNPWINLKLKKRQSEDDESNQDLMQLHDVVVRYFE